MIQNLEKKYINLKSKLKVIEEENKLLSERSEEIILLGLVTESVSLIEDKHVLLENVLERISVLKNIPFCGCYSMYNNNKVAIIDTSTESEVDSPISVGNNPR